MSKSHLHTRDRRATKLYRAWSNMKVRCFNPKYPLFHRYGGRGITVCDRWLTFENFMADVGEPPSARHTIERIDNDRGYEPGNVRWATVRDQASNRRTNRKLTLAGETLTVSEWARRLGLNVSSLLERIQTGWPIEKALTTPNVRPYLRKST